MKRSVRIALAVAVVAGVLAARHFRDAPASPGESSRSSGHYRIPAAATAFRFGTLDFTACELSQKRSAATTAAFCAPFEVPEDRANPDARRIALKLALIRSTEAADDDFIVFLAGGPGQSAVNAWPQVAASLEPSRKRRHVLLLDQRGTGASNPLECKSADPVDEAAEYDPTSVTARARECLDSLKDKADPRFYTTTEAVADLEALRQALGAPKFDLVGVSYGTRVAQQYLKRHPEGVRSIVLDSPVPNELALTADFAGNLDAALKAQFAGCQADAACAKAYPDPFADLLRLRDELRATPRTVSFADPVTFERHERRLDGYGIAGLVRLYAYAPETAALIPLTVKQGLAGNFAPMMGQIDLMLQGVDELIGNGMQFSVMCGEDFDRLPAETGAANADSVLGSALVDAVRAQCAVWPRGTRPADFNEPARGDVPVLVLSGQLDPVTPPRYGEQIVRTLANAKLVVARGQGHSIMGRGCLPKVVGSFMDKLEPATLDTECVAQLGPVPHFLDFNGASP
ncbi:MAG: alpha/beta fold hydrolase [Xanthomonadales bacterium]|nr:alpha/beta fold hydrolase [Xanthomonadales bacterium]